MGVHVRDWRKKRNRGYDVVIYEFQNNFTFGFTQVKFGPPRFI